MDLSENKTNVEKWEAPARWLTARPANFTTSMLKVPEVEKAPEHAIMMKQTYGEKETSNETSQGFPQNGIYGVLNIREDSKMVTRTGSLQGTYPGFRPKKSFLADYPMVCYEEKTDFVKAEKFIPLVLERVLFMKKLSGDMYETSFIIYGRSCSDRGYYYDHKNHPCYPDYVATAFLSAAGQKSYRRYRQELFDKSPLGKFIQATPFYYYNVTEAMLSGDCDTSGWL